MRLYLTVPIVAKDRAKALGARWDWARRQWYAPDGVDAANFLEWLPAEWKGFHERASGRGRRQHKPQVHELGASKGALPFEGAMTKSVGAP